MTAHALISGVLFRAPEQKTSKAGKLYVSATVKFKDGEALQFWRLTAVLETAQVELMRLSEGDALSAQGAMKAELYRPEGGEQRISLSMIADHVTALRQPTRISGADREKRPRASKPYAGRKPDTRRAAPLAHEFDDPLPF